MSTQDNLRYIDKLIIPKETIPAIPANACRYFNISRSDMLLHLFQHYFYNVAYDNFVSFLDNINEDTPIGENVVSMRDEAANLLAACYDELHANMVPLIGDLNRLASMLWDIRVTELVDGSVFVELFYDPDAFNNNI